MEPYFGRIKTSVVVPLLWMVLSLSAAGCTAPAIRGQSPDGDEIVATDESTYQLVGDLARPWGMNYVKVESVALVTGLDGTGSDPPPSSRRAVLINEMLARGVENPNQVLASSTTSLVLVQGYLPPGVQKGDRFDVEIRVPRNSGTTSLQNGWLMQTRLRELAVLNNHIAQGHVLAHAQGSVLADSVVEGTDDDVLTTRGRVLGGGLSATTRSLGLIVRSQHFSDRTSSEIGRAINARFHTFDRGVKTGVATPKRDNFVELNVHPSYRGNIPRYLHVVESIPVRERPADRVARLETLKQELMVASTSAGAAVNLEALGNEGVAALLSGLEADDEEVRFYAAEALAYMNKPEAAAFLAATARDLPAFRRNALTALAAMDELQAQDELAKLLHVPSAETRYGAFRALIEIASNDPLVSGESLDGKLNLHLISSTAEPMVHVTRVQRPEIVLFGADQPLRSPVTLIAGKGIVIKDEPDGTLKVSRFAVGKPDQYEQCKPNLEQLIRTMIKVGASYPDVVDAVQKAKRQGNLASRVEFDAIPHLGRTYHRDEAHEGSDRADDPSDSEVDPEVGISDDTAIQT